jgi:hypothetical protein
LVGTILLRRVYPEGWLAIVKKKMNLGLSLNEILQMLSITLFENVPILQAFSLIDQQDQESNLYNQLELLNS